MSTIEIHARDVGAKANQEILDGHLNVFAVHLLIESVTKSRLLEAIPEGISFTIRDLDPRHAGIRVTITKDVEHAAEMSAWETAKHDAKCGCTRSDAWRCAVDKRMSSVSCSCRCHKYLAAPPTTTLGETKDDNSSEEKTDNAAAG